MAHMPYLEHAMLCTATPKWTITVATSYVAMPLAHARDYYWGPVRWLATTNAVIDCGLKGKWLSQANPERSRAHVLKARG